MESKKTVLTEALGSVSSKYIEEALETRKLRRSAVRLQRVSAACIALAVVALCTVTALAVKYWVPSWKDLFGKDQNVIGEEDQEPLLPDSVSASGDLDLNLEIQGIISDERVLYIPFTLSSKDGTPLDSRGNFRNYRMYFPDKMMSGGYQYFFLGPDGETAPGTLGGVFYAHWQAEPTVKDVVIEVTDWQELETVDAVKVDINIADTVEKAGSNAKLPALYRSPFGYYLSDPQEEYLWQPGGGRTLIPGSTDVYIDNMGWENGYLHIVIRGPLDSDEWTYGRNWLSESGETAYTDGYWYFVDTRTGEKLFVEPYGFGELPDVIFDDVEEAEWNYFWQFLKVGREDLPYLEMYAGGDRIYITKWEGSLTLSTQVPVTIPSEVLARDIPIDYNGEALTIDRIECSKISIAVYFPGYVDSTNWAYFEALDKNGKRIDCRWSFIAEQSGKECMYWAVFDEPLEPGTVCTVTYNGQPIFSR